MSLTEKRETLVGVVALTVIVAVLTLTALGNRASQHAKDGRVTYTAEFTRADGLRIGAPVRMAGMNVGEVGEAALGRRYQAIMTLVLNDNIALPDDTAALIETDGVFGSKYVELQPGGSEDNLKPGARISITQDAVVLEELIAKIVAQAKAAVKKPAASTTGTEQ